MKYCAKCGQQLPDRVRFCAKCGAAQADIKLQELSDRLDRQSAELEAVRRELRGLQPERQRSGTAVQTAAQTSGAETARTAGKARTVGTAQTTGRPQAAEAARPAAKSPGTPGGIEFSIAATVLSVIGVLFLISALMIFGASFLSGMAQGLFLFAVFSTLTAFSELWIRKRLPRFAEITSALGLAGLYAAALINYYYLKTLPGPAVLAVTILISAFAVWLSRQRDSLTLRLILFLGSYTAMMTTETPGLIAAFLTFFINLAAALLPVRRNRFLCSGIHLIAYAVFTILLQLEISEWSLFGHNSFKAENLLPVVLFLIVAECIRLLEEGGHADPAGTGALSTAGKSTPRTVSGMMIVRYVTVLPAVFLSLLLSGCEETQERLVTAAMLSVPVVLGTAAGVLGLKRGKGELYRGAYVLMILWMIIGSAGEEAAVVLPVCLTAMGVSLLIARRESSGSLNLLHLMITVTALMTAACADMPALWVIPAAAALLMFNFQPGFFSAHAAAVILYSVFSIHAHHRVYGLGAYTGELYTDLFCAVLILILTLVLQRVPGKRDRYSALFGQLMLVLILLHHHGLPDCGLHHVYVLFLLAGSAAVFLLCGERLLPGGKTAAADAAIPGARTMPAAGAELRIPVPGWLLYAVYLTYMILVIDIPVPVWISILLLVLACACVGSGFRMKLRYLRLYGLGLAIFSCVKIAVYDFGGLSSGMRVGVFFAAGLLALVISFIYIRLEKKESSGG